MNANDLTFGVEFETTLPATTDVCVGSYRDGMQARHLPEGWLAKSDCSINASAGRIGCEFVSPVLKGEAGLAQVLQVLETLKALGAQVNASCGMHVHVGWAGSDEQLDKLVSLVACNETAIYASTGTTTRERGHYCRGLRCHSNAANAKRNSQYDRYHMLNLSNLHSGRKRTVEFRAFGGTLNATKAVGYITLCLALVEQSHKSTRTAPFVPKPIKATNSAARKGAGQTALARLFYQLGWVKGRTQHTFGAVTCPNAPTLKDIRKEFMRLAKQYDQQREALPY